MADTVDYNCPQCGEPTEILHEGYCEGCRDENQRALDQHNITYDWWRKLTDREREKLIRGRIQAH